MFWHFDALKRSNKLDQIWLTALLSLTVQSVSWKVGPVWARGNPPFPPYTFTSPPSTLSFSIFYFFPSYSLHLFSCFSIPSHCTRIVPLRFQAGCRTRRLNLSLTVQTICWKVFESGYLVILESVCQSLDLTVQVSRPWKYLNMTCPWNDFGPQNDLSPWKSWKSPRIYLRCCEKFLPYLKSHSYCWWCCGISCMYLPVDCLSVVLTA